MRSAIGRLFDSLGILLAAVLTLCGFLLLFAPWKQAMSVRIVESPKPASGEVFVNVGAPQKPH
jgi:hypothetical protein